MLLTTALLLTLSQIDDHCADTWCESNTDYEFKAIQCDPLVQSCELIVDIIPWGIACGRRDLPRFERICTIKNNNHFYENLGDCLNQESDLLYLEVEKPC